jgi:hypothetical protein
MKNNFNILIVILLLILIIPAEAQISEQELTGSLSVDSKILSASDNFESLPQLSVQVENRKSPFLAGLLSLVVPGAGEFYSESYLKAAIFAAVEAAVITTGLIYDNKGNDQTEFFQRYADQNWSVVKYADWIIATFYQGEENPPNIVVNRNSSLPPWEQVDWIILNQAEQAKNVGSHHLPPYGDQQYFELIGKYYQFTAGWDDYAGGNISEFTPHLLYYADEHAKADEYYNVAAKAVIVIYINHFLSALDAVWSAVNYNKSLAVKIQVEENYLTNEFELIPTLKLSYSF